ncbi:MAG: hypothetical protein ACRDHN_01080 [Thermomicrobiales bacterium]
MKRIPWRLGIVLVLMLSMLGIAAPSAVVAQSGTATLTIHSRFCPPGYNGTDIFETCHDNIGIRGVQYTVEGVGAADIPDDEGNLVFAGLTANDYRISSSLPSDLNRAYVYCSNSDGSTGRQIPTYLDSDDVEMFDLSLVAGDNVICDWYTIPNEDYNSTRANITIHNRFCPPDYSDFGNEWKDCLGNVGITLLQYSASGPTNRSDFIRSGNVTFSWIEPGVYTISNDLMYQIDASVYCSTTDSIGMPFLSTPLAPDETLTFSIDEGDDVICDWYEYPSSEFYQSGSASPMSVVACEKPTGVGHGMGGLPEGCFSVDGVDITAYPTLAGPSFGQTCTTGQPGGCIVYLPAVIPLSVEIDESDLPAGYAPQCNPCSWSQYGEWTGTVIEVNPTDASSKGD